MKVALTGGGTLGHVVPAVSVALELEKRGAEVLFIGSRNGNEKDFVEKRGIRFFAVPAEKLRRYFSLKTLALPFRLISGYSKSRRILKAEKPDMLFSKGGYVSVPVSYAAKSLGIPVITHESDSSLGLASRMIARFADILCLGNPACRPDIKTRTVYTGNPIRDDIKNGNAERFAKEYGIPADRPVMLVLGGSLGAQKVNETVVAGLDELTRHCTVILQCGKGKRSGVSHPLFFEFESFDSEFADVLALSSFVISRAGAGAIAELSSLCLPVLYIPLGTEASRGDQIMNARIEEKEGRALVCTYDGLVEKAVELADNETLRENLSRNCRNTMKPDSAKLICDLISELADERI